MPFYFCPEHIPECASNTYRRIRTTHKYLPSAAVQIPLIDVTPSTYSAATMINVVSDVKILLESVWLILLLTSSSKESFFSIVPRFFSDTVKDYDGRID